MRQIYIAQDPVEARGITAVVSGEDISLTDSCVWVTEDVPFEVVQEVMLTASHKPIWVETSLESWSCPGCGERIEAQFSVWWQCGTSQL